MPVITNESGERKTGNDVVWESTEHQREVEAAERERQSEPRHVVRAGAMTGGASLAVIGGGGAVVLAILGLAGFLPTILAAIATIGIGAGLLAHGAAASARAAERMTAAPERQRVEVAGGLGSEVFGGAGGVVLGILALAHVMPNLLLPVAAIVLGGAILFGAVAEPPLAKLARPDRADHVSYEIVEGTSGAMALAGAGAVVLGILALVNVGPVLPLTLVAMLAIGAALFLESGALAARFARHMHHA